MSKINMLWAGDAVAQTGFSRVTHGVLDQLYVTGDYNLSVMGINYRGDPHSYPYPIYPAGLGGDALGYNRLASLVESTRPEVIVLFNDLWVVINWLNTLKDNYKGAIMTYFPVDATGYNPDWVKALYNFEQVIVYTNFAKEVLREAGFRRKVEVIPHGLDRGIYKPVPQGVARSTLSGINPDDFIVLNANRNQPRKRIDTTIRGFCKFAADKPDSVRLYLHMGILDLGWDILSMMERDCKRNGIKDFMHRLLITHPELSPGRAVSERDLNIIYNTADVGLNTSMGEGWGLVNFEHSACKVPQIVPGFSATKELYEGRGLLLPAVTTLCHERINTEGGVIDADDVADALQTYYDNPDLREQHAQAMYDYVCREEFTWESVANRWDKLIKETVR